MSDPRSRDPSVSPGGFKLLTAEARQQATALAWQRLAAFVIDAALFALLIFALVQVDDWVLEGALGLYAPFEVEERLVEERQELLEGGVLREVRTYEEIRTYENGTQATYLRIEEHRAGERPDGEPWDAEITHYEFVEGDEGRPGRYGYYTLAFLIILPLPYRYFTESSRWQGTVGKRLMGIRVTDWSLKRPSPGKVLERNLWRFLSVITFGFGYVMIFFTRNNQCLHDKLANTLVVRAKASEAGAQT